MHSPSLQFAAVHFELTCADMPTFLSTLAAENIPVHDIRQTDPLTLLGVVRHVDFPRFSGVSKRFGATVKEKEKTGIYWRIKGMLKRPVFLIGVILLLALILWLPSRVLFVRVDGNHMIPTKLIIEKAEKCGIGFCASRRNVRSEKIKNALLSEIPQLEWTGVNTYGCIAVISVKERIHEKTDSEFSAVSSIIAARDGIIKSFTAINGNALCRVGQAVKAGETLISGYTDCGLTIRATRAEGEILAETKHDITVLMPTDYKAKGSESKSTRKYSLLFGKKRINLYKGSGISGATCDKMYSEYYVTLPGGFCLPVALIVEQVITHEADTVSTSGEECRDVAYEFAEKYLLEHMVSGHIVDCDTTAKQMDDVLYFRGEYICTEMIGRVQHEEIIGKYGKNN